MPGVGAALIPLAALVVTLAVVAIARGTDVRLALMAAALALAGLEGDVAPILREFLATFSNEKFVVPICMAMGFARVLCHAECDKHFVRLLTNPLRRAKWFLVPGVIAVGFVVNIPVISQTSTAVCLGAVVVPLMRAAGFSPAAVGATILFGASVGGELLNPGAPELNTVGTRLGIPSKEVVPRIVPVVFAQLALGTVLYWLLTARAERRTPVPPAEAAAPAGGRASVVKAAVPLVPLALLFLSGPPLNVVEIPARWLVPDKVEPAAFAAGGPAVAVKKRDPAYETRLVGAAMLVGVLAAMLAAPRAAGGAPKAFFEGAGYGFAEIVSLIVTANCFGKAVEQVGLAKLIGEAIREVPDLLWPAAGGVPLAFAALSGSGMASTQSLYGFFVDPARAHGVDPADVGAVVAVGAAAGRTMSPVAAVCLMCAKLTGTSPFALARRVAGPLLAAFALVVALRMLGAI